MNDAAVGGAAGGVDIEAVELVNAAALRETARNERFDIVVAFDNDPKKIGTTIRGKEILPVTKLVDLVKRMHVKLGLLTVPSQNAQQVADLMVEAGIKGIWNFAPAALNVPQDVYVHQEDMVASLAILIKKMGATELQDLHK